MIPRVSQAMYILILVITYALVNADIPRHIAYQGMLTDTVGNPRPDGKYEFTFSLYESSTGGTALWSQREIKHVKQGLFSTFLGSVISFGPQIKFDKPYYLGIKIGIENELLPRIPITSVAYSFYSLKTDSALHAKKADTSSFATQSGGINVLIQRMIDTLKRSDSIQAEQIGQLSLANDNLKDSLNMLKAKLDDHEVTIIDLKRLCDSQMILITEQHNSIQNLSTDVLDLNSRIDSLEQIGYLNLHQFDITDSVKGSGDWTTIKAVGVPYRTVNGVWRLIFNLDGSGLLQTTTISISGIVFKIGYNQEVGYSSGASGTTQGKHYAADGTNSIQIYLSTQEWRHFISGDVELNSKPTWVDQ